VEVVISHEGESGDLIAGEDYVERDAWLSPIPSPVSLYDGSLPVPPPPVVITPPPPDWASEDSTGVLARNFGVSVHTDSDGSDDPEYQSAVLLHHLGSHTSLLEGQAMDTSATTPIPLPVPLAEEHGHLPSGDADEL